MEAKISFYKVGGCVRDRILGIPSKDIDYVAVFDSTENLTPDQAFHLLHTHLVEDKKCKIFLSVPEMYTIRAKWVNGEDADFVIARKEVGYIEGTRRPELVLGTLKDDLERRDFTVNAIAEDLEGNYIDPFGGILDIQNKLLRTPLNPVITMMDDPLRILRALRFSITKGFKIDENIFFAMNQKEILGKLSSTVSTERIREELSKMFQYDTPKSIKLLHFVEKEVIPGFFNVIFRDGLWLMPTNKKLKN